MNRSLLLSLSIAFCFSAFTSFQRYDTPVFKGDPDNCLDDLDVPKRFTPDGDQLEDVFVIPFPCKPEFFEIHIADRLAEEVFVANVYTFSWNGNDKKGVACVSGIYDWKIKYMYHMNFVEVSGQVLLLR